MTKKKPRGKPFAKGNRYARLGGMTTSRDTTHMKAIGSKGGKERARVFLGKVESNPLCVCGHERGLHDVDDGGPTVCLWSSDDKERVCDCRLFEVVVYADHETPY